ncbi:MAG: TRAP transporter small permease [Deltaproteobacteria bacterium]|nr:TRAP transporter small permease [Deltaproteobacteria bacterium]
MMAKLPSRFSEGLTAIFELISSVCLAILTALVIAQVVLRYVFNAPLTWSEELARILFIYLTFMGIVAAYGRRRHMFVDSLIALLPPVIIKILHSSVLVVASTFLVVVSIITARSMAELFRMELTTPVLELSMALVYLSIPVGASALMAQMLIHLLARKEE